MNISPFKIALTSPIYYDTFVSEEPCTETPSRVQYTLSEFSPGLILRTKILRDDTLFFFFAGHFHRFYPTLSER